MGATQVMPVIPEGYTGQKSRQGAMDLAGLRDAIANRTLMSVTVSQVVGGEIYVLLGSNGLGGHQYGVMAPEEFDEKIYAGYEGFVGELVDIIVTGYEAQREVALVSRRQARLIKREELLKHLEVGSVVTGVVRAIQPFGAFLDIGGLHAILPVNEISHTFVDHPGDVLNKGDVLEVKVISFDLATLKARVSVKAMSDPWEKVASLYAKGAILFGGISGVRGEQVWVRPEPYHGLEVLCPALPNRRYEEGKQVRIKLVTVDPAAKKLRGRIIGVMG
jgi:small subunit ribosomal protein S1